MTVSLRDLIIGLDQMGFYDVALPFIVIFAISFALFEKIKIFSNKSINGVLALGMGFAFLQNDYLLRMFHRVVPNVAFLILAILLLLLLVGLFAGENKPWGGFLMFIAFFFAIASLITAASYDKLGSGYASWWQWFVDLDTGSKTTLLGLILVAVILWLVFRTPSSTPRTFGQTIDGWLGRGNGGSGGGRPGTL